MKYLHILKLLKISINFMYQNGHVREHVEILKMYKYYTFISVSFYAQNVLLMYIIILSCRFS